MLFLFIFLAFFFEAVSVLHAHCHTNNGKLFDNFLIAIFVFLITIV